MRTWVLALCLILSAGGSAFGQTDPSVATQLRYQRAQTALHELPERLKKMDVPELRVFLRQRIASYLWTKNLKAEFKFAENMVEAGLEDLDAHKSDMKDADTRYYQGKLLALLRSYSPQLATKLADKYDLNKDERQSFAVASSMLSTKNVALAVETVSRTIKMGLDGGLPLLIFLTDLEKEHPQECYDLLLQVIAAEESRRGTLSIVSLHMLKGLYLKEQVQAALKLRFLSTVVNSAERTISDSNSENMVAAYNLLNAVYAEIEKFPALPIYTRARLVVSFLSSRVPGGTLERTALQSRVEKSDDLLRQLRIEVDSSTNDSNKDNLRTQAARVALQRGELGIAVDFAAKTSDEGQQGRWRDQFLEEVLDAALKEKDEDIAQTALSKMKLASNRASGTQKLAVFFFESRDIVRAREWMSEAVKIAESSDNNVEKARRLIEFVPAFKKVDETRVFEIIVSAMKFIDRIPPPGVGERPGSSSRKAYAESLTSIAWHAIPAFRILFQQDEIRATEIANGIHSAEIRGAALWGMTSGLLESSTVAASATQDK